MELTVNQKFLSALGIDGDKADQICTMHSNGMTRIKAELDDIREKLDNANSELKKVTRERDKLKEQVPDEDGKNPFEDKYNKVKREFDEYKSQVAAKELLEKKKAAYKELCKDAELSEKGTEKALKYADWAKVELDENGEIKGKADHLKGVKEEWSDYVQKVETSGAEVKTPPAGEKTAEKPNRAAELAAKFRAANYGGAEQKQNKEGD